MIDISSFLHTGQLELAPYITGVNEFISKVRKDPNSKADSLRLKPPEVYCRNMLAVGVLNRLNRELFLQTTKRVIVLPDCLKNYGEWTCCKADTGIATECTQCTDECLVFESVERFADENTAIVLEPDDLKKYLSGIKEAAPSDVGVIGVACALTLLSGFQRTLDLQMPTQGVFLNYSSCAHHWAEPAYNTNYSFTRMGWVLDKNGNGEPGDSNHSGETYTLEKSPLTPEDFYMRLDELAEQFEKEYYPNFRKAFAQADPFELQVEVMRAIVPDLITRDSA
ncbi:MAG: DUF116 domain-containing protein [FCB group bacterium]|nr:DUF116 domain-containing protein [FCB group bacterium]